MADITENVTKIQSKGQEEVRLTERKYLFYMETQELADAINSRFKNYVSHQYSQQMRYLMRRAYAAYYGHDFGEYGEIGRAGEQSEYSTIVINHARSIIKNIMALALQNRLVFDCIAMNSDVQARNNAVIGNALLEQFFTEKRIEQLARYAFELGLMSGTAYIFCGWKTDVNPVGVDPDTGKIVYSGAPDVYAFSLLDVYLEPFRDNWDTHNWLVFRRLENRFDLMQKYPEIADKIEDVRTAQEQNGEFRPHHSDDEAPVWVYYGFHKPTPALPNGRYFVCMDDGVVLVDDVNPYEEIPVICYRPETRFGSAYGHTPFFDLMPIQQTINNLDSATVTMAENYAIPNIVASDTFGANESDLAGGLKIVTGKPDPDAPNGGFPQPMNMPKPDEAYTALREKRVMDMEAISGINSTVRGQTSANASGTAIALTTAAAQQFNSVVESGYIYMVEDLAYMLIKVCRLFMRTKELVAIAGKYQEFMVKTFDASDLESIKRVKVSLGNPFAKSLAGRVEVATQLLNAQKIDGDQYMNIIVTGQIEQQLEPKVAEQTYLALENEQLMRNEKPVISPLDNHIKHIQTHHTLLALPNIRMDAAVLALVLDHISEHVEQMTKLAIDNPMMLDIALGNPPRIPQPGPEAMLNPGGAPLPGGEEGGAPLGDVDTPMGKQTVESAEMGGAESVAQAGEDRAATELAQAQQSVAPSESPQ